jgi:hypothetical protein
MAESELIGLHFGLGMWIRNNLGLWQGNDELMQVIRERDQAIHTDDVSMVIIAAVWRAAAGRWCRRCIEWGDCRPRTILH